MRAVYFQHPDDHTWHTLAWEHAPALDMPFSSEALTYARRLAARTQRFPDTATTLVQLLERWGAGLTEGAAERRMAVRLSQQRLRLLDGTPDHPATDATDTEQISALPSVRRLTAIAATPTRPPEDNDADDGGPPAAVPLGPPAPDQAAELGGDDDEDDELDDIELDDDEEEDFYADVMDSG